VFPTVVIDSPGLLVPGAPGEVGAGQAGNTTINATTLVMRGGAAISVGSQGAGAGGDIVVNAPNVTITGGSQISGSTTRDTIGGAGGRVTLNVASLELSEAGALTSASAGSGNAGDVTVDATGRVRLVNGGAITTEADQANGGNVVVSAQRLDLFNSQVQAQAGGDGGNIAVTADKGMQSRDSQISGRAGNDGGLITLTATPTILEQSVIDGRAGGVPVFVTIDSDIFLRSNSQILTTTLSLPPEVDIAGSLVALPTHLLSASATLRELCSVSLEEDVSSFRATGRGGVPASPDGWAPALLDLPEDN
jgi:large exoprotein involved in heme utilization and adhesion